MATMLIKRLRDSSIFHQLTVSTLTATISVESCPSLCIRYNAGRNYHVNSAPKRGIFAQRSLSNLKLLRVGWLNRTSLSSSAFDDDDFAELGSPVEQGRQTVLKLMTAKPERIWKKKKTDWRKEILLTSPALLGSSTVLNYASSESDLDTPVGQGPQTTIKLMTEKPERFSEKKTDSRKEISLTSPAFLGCRSDPGASDSKKSCSITVKNVPLNINLSQLKKAASIFGTISNAAMRSVSKRLYCYIEFQKEESCRRAISAGQITVRNCKLRIYPLHTQNNMPESLLRKENDTLDSLSSVLDSCGIKAKLERLNNRDTDDCQRSGNRFRKESTPVVNNSNCEDQIGLLEVSSEIADYKRKIMEKKVCAEDLENLHQAIVYLEHHPLQN